VLESENLLSVFVGLRAHMARAVSKIVPPHEVEDIVQETYVRLCQIDNNTSIKHPRSYLLKMVINLALDHVKRAEHRLRDRQIDVDELLPAEFDPERDEIYEIAVLNEEFGLFCEAVRLLPVQCRRVFVLKKVYGYSQREIAIELNISENTVEKHVALAIKRCTYFMLHHTSKDTLAGENQEQPTMREAIYE